MDSVTAPDVSQQQEDANAEVLEALKGLLSAIAKGKIVANLDPATNSEDLFDYSARLLRAQVAVMRAELWR